MKIQDIITTFKGKTFSSHEEVVEWLESSLTSLLDSLVEETREQCCYTQTTLSSGKKVNLISKEEVINIINSHR